jgi:uncharacterized protein involved in exopolysaccharide biosynthesis
MYRVRYWLIILPLVVGLLFLFFTRNQERIYEVDTTVYTGVISGDNSIINDPEASTSSVQNAKIDNMITIITSVSTLRKVSIKLFAISMIYGRANENNTYIKASNYQELQLNTPEEVKQLIDTTSVDKTVENLTKYSEGEVNNYVYGLFEWNHRHYGYDALSKIVAKRIGFSDIIKITYSADDPGIAYNTLKLISEIFVDQYDQLQIAGADDVIEFFRQELKRVELELNKSEDELTDYNVKNKVINYGEQTKQIAAMNRDFTLELEDNRLKYFGTKSLVENLEKKIGSNIKILKSNNEFLQKLRNISSLTSLITEIESFGGDSTVTIKDEVKGYNKQLNNAEKDFTNFVESFYSEKYSKEGYPNEETVEEWVTQVLKLEEYAAQKKVLDDWKSDLDSQYSYYSPIGATIKRKERGINFTEASYLAVLKALHDAILRQKNMEMSSATLKVVTPPSFPLSAMASNRKATILAAFLGTFLLVLFFFIIVDFLDRTLRDRLRTERITGGKVIGAFPVSLGSKDDASRVLQQKIATQQLSNTLITYFGSNSPQIINVLSIDPQEGKTMVVNHLQAYWQLQGFSVRVVNWETDLKTKIRELTLCKSVAELIDLGDEDIVLIEYPPLKDQFVAHYLLQDTICNLFVASANRVWKESDEKIFNNLINNLKDTPLMIELNYAALNVVEEFTGLLPPYGRFRKIGYRLLQMGFSSNEKMN